MFYYLYQIRNNVNGKIYIGVHKTNDLNDGYMGSGKRLHDAYKHHGIENFTKTILEEFNNSDEMYAREKQIVTEEFLNRNDTYNLRRGGTGGFDFINNSGIQKFKGKSHSVESRSLMGHPGNNHAVGNTGGKKNKGKKRERIECPHCHKICGVNMIVRHHLDKCKMRV